MEARTRRMPADWDLTVEQDGTVVLWLRDGMLPRATVYELGVLIADVRGTLVRPAT